MNLEESLNQRLEILLSSGVITQSISDYSKTVVKLLINQKPEADSDRAAMFITHLAMAGQRILEGKEEKPLDGQILETVKQEPVYGSALDFLTYMLNQTDLEFPDTEKDFLTVHLCNLFMGWFGRL